MYRITGMAVLVRKGVVFTEGETLDSHKHDASSFSQKLISGEE